MDDTTEPQYKEYAIEAFPVRGEPYYRPVGDELELFTAPKATHSGIAQRPHGLWQNPLCRIYGLEAGPPSNRGAGRRPGSGPNAASCDVAVPLVTIACHEDFTASDLVGRYLLDASGTSWIDGPMTRAVKTGAILYLDEVVEARKDTTVSIHPLTDHRRILPVEKRGTIIEADDRFLLCISTTPTTKVP